MTENKRDFYSVKEVAKTLHISISTVHSFINDGLLKAYRIGRRGRWRITHKAFNEFLENSKVETQNG